MTPAPAIIDLGPSTRELGDAVLAGLSQSQKQIPCKFLYDERGSELFDAICELDEYYPTRTETALLRAHRDEIASIVGPGVTVIDLGSGSSQKIDILLSSLVEPAAYVPVDISREYLAAAAARIASAHPALRVVPVCADYTDELSMPRGLPGGPVLVFFPGSTIGNFDPEAAEVFLRRLGPVAGPGGSLLIGVDTDKDARILEAAYDDARGVTAAFNLNLLARINRELGADFDTRAFSHRAVYDRRRGCIEMHLVSDRDQRVHVAGATFALGAGETIHTEDSYKYRLAHFDAIVRRAGWRPSRRWVDDGALFSVHLLRRPGDAD